MTEEIKPVTITYWRELTTKEFEILKEVVKHGISYCGKPMWNTYLYIHKKEMVDWLWSDNKTVYDWGEVLRPNQIVDELNWNGGQTYYHQCVDGSHRYIKVGDDYQHIWDEHEEHNENILIENIRFICNQLIEKWKAMTP
jgi:hypothetical protein